MPPPSLLALSYFCMSEYSSALDIYWMAPWRLGSLSSLFTFIVGRPFFDKFGWLSVVKFIVSDQKLFYILLR